jgi:hypothetical protein
VVAALVLLPFLRHASYRARDVLLITLVPIYGAMVAAVVVSRLVALPRRDWPPRPDEVDRVVRIPRSRGAYLLRPTFADAESLRARWCVNPGHHHPYATWSLATSTFCRDRGGD